MGPVGDFLDLLFLSQLFFAQEMEVCHSEIPEFIDTSLLELHRRLKQIFEERESFAAMVLSYAVLWWGGSLGSTLGYIIC